MANLKTAVLVILVKDNKVLFLKRTHGWGAGTYSLPGGNVELHESLTQAAIREVAEEVGVQLEPHNLSFVNLSHIKNSDTDIEYLLVTFVATQWKREPFNKEPEKHSEMVWLDMDNLPEEIHTFGHKILQAYKDNKTFSEFGWDKN
jgi:ADP-ribose pyrophosphatase YjhB (NUDIX family)